VVVNSPRTLLTDDHLVGRDFWVTLEHPVAGAVPACGPSWRLGESLTGQWEPAPTLGQHTDEVLTSLLGYAATELDRLYRDEVIA
jgi:crotonobetainyl-CoA:carnitine CoA-transferase CaiB-like acyl-CoA transferase